MSHEDFESARAYLQSTHIHDHLSNVLQKIIREKPSGDVALREFESYSHGVKQSLGYSTAPSRPAAEDTTRIITALTRTQALIRPPPTDDEDDATNTIEPAPNAAILPNLSSLLILYEHAGIGMDRSTCYQLSLSMHNLVREYENMESIRFWGKIVGTTKDYYIVETKLNDYQEEEQTQDEDEPEDPELDKKEPAGTGINEYVYFVTNSLIDSKWIQLPALTPEQITTSRGVRRFFTGDLSAPVLGFPRFPWYERVYLRCQITRITHATTIAPKGYYMLDEEEQDEVMIQNEEFPGVIVNNQLQTSAWVHTRPHLLKQGRLTNYIAPEVDEDDETPQPRKEELEPHIKLLSTLEYDYRKPPHHSPEDMKSPIPASLVESQCWSFRISPRVDDPHAIVSAHSITWPGSVSITRGKQYTNVYMGWGLKLQTKKYVPARPPPMMQEYVPTATNPLVEQTDPITRPVNPDDDEELKDDTEDEPIKSVASDEEDEDVE